VLLLLLHFFLTLKNAVNAFIHANYYKAHEEYKCKRNCGIWSSHVFAQKIYKQYEA